MASNANQNNGSINFHFLIFNWDFVFCKWNAPHRANFIHQILIIPVSQRWLMYLPKQIHNLGRGVYEISIY